MRVKTLWIQDKYLKQILEGRKTIEVRVGYSNIARLEVGDTLLLNGDYPFVIRRIGRYPNFEALLANEENRAIAPDLSANRLLEALRETYPTEKEVLGVIAVEIAPIILTKP